MSTNSTDISFYIALSQAPGIGPARFKILLDNFPSAKEIWKAPNKLLQEILGQKVFENFQAFRTQTDPDKILANLGNKKINFITLQEDSYPSRLKEIPVPPPVLYYQGRLPKDALALAVVGSRKVTSYGKEVTEILVEALTKAGLTIVSGLARGVDSIAHQTSLEADGVTWAVLGSGVDVIYPPQNTRLAAQIIEKGGAIISEFAPGTVPIPGNFPARNRIISGLSLGVLVTEADENSGSLITASYALEQNREVFAVPGPIYSKLSHGPSKLIKQGAKLASSVEDILEELNLAQKVSFQKAREVIADSPEEKIILDLLENEPKHVDEIIRESHLSSDTLSSLLTTMELKGKLKNLGGGSYSLNR